MQRSESPAEPLKKMGFTERIPWTQGRAGKDPRWKWAWLHAVSLLYGHTVSPTSVSASRSSFAPVHHLDSSAYLMVSASSWLQLTYVSGNDPSAGSQRGQSCGHVHLVP